MRLTHVQMVLMIGASRETVTRLGDLSCNRLIRLEGSRLVIRNHESLVRWLPDSSANARSPPASLPPEQNGEAE